MTKWLNFPHEQPEPMTPSNLPVTHRWIENKAQLSYLPFWLSATPDETISVFPHWAMLCWRWSSLEHLLHLWSGLAFSDSPPHLPLALTSWISQGRTTSVIIILLILVKLDHYNFAVLWRKHMQGRFHHWADSLFHGQQLCVCWMLWALLLRGKPWAWFFHYSGSYKS